MRKIKKLYSIKIEEHVYNRIAKDQEHFQKKIGGGKWSKSDTIQEWIKILDILNNEK